MAHGAKYVDEFRRYFVEKLKCNLLCKATCLSWIARKVLRMSFYVLHARQDAEINIYFRYFKNLSLQPADKFFPTITFTLINVVVLVAIED